MATTNWRVRRRTRPDLLSHLSLVRGISVKELELDFASQLNDPNLLPGMKAARQLIVKAGTESWPVTIFGDYDADGTPAAALLSSLLDRLKIKHQVIIPTRAVGYGLKENDVESIAASSKLLILVDTGVNAVGPVALLKKAGVEVVILDHHLPKAELPATKALVDPFLPGSKYPFDQLCGCALAYKLATALAADFPTELSESWLKWQLDLVAISTVTDMMVMKGENRVLVHYGLQVLRKTRRPGLKALMAAAGVDPDKLSAGTLGYSLGPRLNATGRLGDNRPAFDLLVSTSAAAANEQAQAIEKSNRDRQQLVEEVLLEAQGLIFKQNKSDDRCFIIVGDDWLPGVVGLVAGKIAGQFNRPTIVLTRQNGVLTGSARSIGGYSIIDGLTSQTKQLIRFGGHRQAAGLSLEDKSLADFILGLKAHAFKNIPASALVRSYTADAILADEEVVLATVDLCDRFQPFGVENQSPLFIIEDVQLGAPRLIGAKGDHVKWAGRKNNIDLDIIGFGMSDRLKKRPLEQAHLLGHLEKNVWNNQTRLQFRLVDLQPVAATFELI